MTYENLKLTRNVSIGHGCPHKSTLDTELTFDTKCDLDLEFKTITR